MKRVFEGDDAGTTGGGSRNLHGVLDSLGTAVHEQSLLRELPRRDLIQPFRQANVAFVGSDLNTRVQKFFELAFDRGEHARCAMPCVQAPNSAGKIDIAIAIDILEN